MSILRTENLTLLYSAKTPFEHIGVDNISIEIEKGDFVGIIGHTGSGKSSFTQMLNGLIKPTSGKVYLDGEDIWQDQRKIRDVRFKVGLVFQYPEYQLFEETVYKDIAFGPTNMGLSESEIKERVYSSCKFVGLDESLLEKSPFDLSGGEKRRVAIAGVIAMDPEILILDEPTAGLDPMGRDLIMSQLSAYHRKRNNTVILVSHSMEDVAQNCDKVLVMNKSKCAMFDTAKNVFSNRELLYSVGLKTPCVTEITQSLKEKGFALPSGILNVEDAVLQITELLKREGKL